MYTSSTTTRWCVGGSLREATGPEKYLKGSGEYVLGLKTMAENWYKGGGKDGALYFDFE